ncbi:3-isopropylmalate dehydratase small subunit [Aliiroseovarius sp. F20344]|uniref:3-isopropylmalate dehydratase small subunit n=1 Tax=Aliiroseovarius sp. F20344 TaxID=2926414 RepID=UPI001FF28D80|nr:3-isopropylmalate dehydratase small subunit [Aliiroseovarius sp. F20344]MCK0142276.1 3-isopropylmalate dehydratase small subunit [Aliiroseovarius sp. F20344]
MPDQVTGLMAAFPQPNVDTDVIMPKRFLITITREGLADGTLADLRFDEDNNKRPEFVLNRSPWTEASILVVGDNFGCGSSREHAVWGLMQLGIKGVIGSGFAGIFYDNARKNGLALPIVSPEVRDELMQVARDPDAGQCIIDITNRRISVGSQRHPFEMDEATRAALLEGRDDTLDTLKLAQSIRAYESNLTQKMRVNVIQ